MFSFLFPQKSEDVTKFEKAMNDKVPAEYIVYSQTKSHDDEQAKIFFKSMLWSGLAFGGVTLLAGGLIFAGSAVAPAFLPVAAVIGASIACEKFAELLICGGALTMVAAVGSVIVLEALKFPQV